jgi:hypothetical protein
MATESHSPKTITLHEAENRIANWSKANPNMVKAFAFDINEVTYLLNNLPKTISAIQPEYGALRFYLGLNDAGVYSLMMVPVEGPYDPDHNVPGKDVVMSVTEDSRESSIYDFSSPCPHLCDRNSPLFKAGNSLNKEPELHDTNSFFLTE